MKIKLDEHMPRSLVASLTALGHDVDTVIDEGLAGLDDGAVRQGARAAGRLIITQDLGFGAVAAAAGSADVGLIQVRLHNASRRSMHDFVASLAVNYQLDSWAGCLVVVSEHKIRVRRLALG